MEAQGDARDPVFSRVPFERWLADGDAALEVVGSGAIGEKLECGAGRLECVVLPHSYRHLTPLVNVRSTSQEAEEAAPRVDETFRVSPQRSPNRGPEPFGTRLSDTRGAGGAPI